MRLFSTRKSRATRRAEAKAIKARAKLEARLSARNEIKRIKAEERSRTRAANAGRKAQRDSDRAAIKIAETQLKTVREGQLLSPTKIKRLLTVSRLLAPVVVPVVYRAAVAARGALDQRRAERLGVPISRLGRFSGSGGQLSARIAGAEQSLRTVAERHPRDAEAQQFVSAIGDKLADLGAAVTAAENMPSVRRRSAHAAISDQLDGIEADILARLGLS